MLIMNILIGIDDLAKFGPKTEMSSNFHEIWHLEQIQHSYYECNIRQYLEHSYDYRLRIIIGSEHGTIIRTIT